MHRSGKRLLALVAIVAVVVGVIALNTVLALGWRAPRLDLTQEKLYTLSPGVKQLVRNLDEKVHLDFYWSDSVGSDLPQYRMLAQQTREFLDELASASGGKIDVKQIDPKPFSEDEDAARASGLAIQPIDNAGRTLTLGIVVRGPTDKNEVIPFLNPEEQPFLEYELARRILAVERAKKPVVVVLSTLPENRGGDPRNPAAGAPSIMLQQLRTLFDVRYLPVGADGIVAIPPEAQVLVLIQPRGYAEATLKTIDSWVSSGRPTLAFLDPWCETDPAARQQGFNQGNSGTTFELGPLLTTWGLEMPKDEAAAGTMSVVGDKTYATLVRARVGNQIVELNYLPYLSLRDKAIAANDPIAGTLKTVNMMTVGSLLKTKDATTTIDPFLSSSTDCELISTLKLGFFGQADQLLQDFKPLGTVQSLGVRVNGPIKSAYAAPPAEGAAPAPAASANIIVLADADMLEDGAWVRENRFGGQLLGYTAFADNSELVINALEALTGDRALSDLRGRGQYRRPFERVEVLRKAANDKFLEERKALDAKFAEGEQRINQLQREKTPGDQNALVLSPEQDAELKKLRAAQLETQKSQRALQHRLVADVERLGRSLMLVNVVLWPIFVALFASFWMIGRVRQQARVVDLQGRPAMTTRGQVSGRVIVGAIVIAFLIAGAWWVTRSTEMEEAPKGPLVSALKGEADSLGRIEVTQADKSVALAKQGDGWVVESSGGYPAEFDKVRALVSDLAALERDEALTAKKERLSEMSLEWPDPSGKARLVRLVPASGTPIEIVFGEEKYTPKSQYARLLSENQAWRCRGTVDVQTDPSRWMKTTLLALPGDEVIGITYQGLELRPGSDASKPGQWDAIIGAGPVDEAAWPETKQTEAKRALPSWLTRFDFDDVRPRSAEWVVDPNFTITFDTQRALVHVEGMTNDGATWVRFCADTKDNAPPIPDDKKQKDDVPAGTPYVPDWKAWSEQVAQWEYKLPEWKRSMITRIHEPKPPPAAPGAVPVPKPPAQ